MNQLFHQSEDVPATEAGRLSLMATRLWARRKVFGVSLAMSLLVVLGVVLVLPAKYQTTGMVIVGNLDSSSTAAVAGNEKLGDPADLESQLLIAKSPRMIRLALERPGVLEALREECERGGLFSSVWRRDCSALKPGSDALLKYAAPRYTVRAEGRSRVLSMSYRASSADVAFILANALIVTYLEDQRAENGQAREDAAKWLLAPSGGSASGKNVFYKNLYSKATDFETERRSLPNPSRLVSFAEMPDGPISKMPVIAIGVALSILLSGFIALHKILPERILRVVSRARSARQRLSIPA